ncbi:MAG: adenylate/guanylate cyclase domain-containing protein, partial [Gammaproteobacteria bacterium]|nr:adenylate/guanylate cyclase domain-containing protein [Gammaproteobacteria bacterium]
FVTNEIITDIAIGYSQESSERIREQVRAHIDQAGHATRAVGVFMQANLEDEQNIIIHEKDLLWSLLWPLLLEGEALQSIYIADEQGNFLQVRREPQLATRLMDRSQEGEREVWVYRDAMYGVTGVERKNVLFDHRERDWYRNTGTEPRNYWTSPYVFKTGGKKGITVTYPIVNTEGKRTHVVAADILLEELSQFLLSHHVTEHSASGLITSEGQIVAAPALLKAEYSEQDKVWLQERLPAFYERFVEYQKSPSPQYRLYREEDDQYWLVTYTPVGILDWYLGTAIPENDLTGKAMYMVNRMIVVSAFILIAAVFLIYFLIGRVSKPLVEISRETERLKKFDLENVRPVKSMISEIDQVSRSLVSSVEALKAFRRYVPAELVRELVERGKGGELGGERRELTLFFSDIESFTTASESLEPEEVMLQLSEYFDAMTKVIMAEQGTVDKFIGDAVMAFWGAPRDVSDPALHACRAALRCQERLAELNDRWEAEGRPRFKTRIGLHTDAVVVGNVGSSERMNYSAIGDGVNLASRLEGLNKQYGTWIMLSEATYKQVHDHFECRLLDEVVVKGKTRPVRVYELLGTVAASSQA